MKVQRSKLQTVKIILSILHWQYLIKLYWIYIFLQNNVLWILFNTLFEESKHNDSCSCIPMTLGTRRM